MNRFRFKFLSACFLSQWVNLAVAADSKIDEYLLSIVTTSAFGLEHDGLIDRSRCEITNTSIMLLEIVDGNPLVRRLPIETADPMIPDAKSRIAELVDATTGVSEPTFPSGVSGRNFWFQRKGEDHNQRHLLKAIQNGQTITEDLSASAQTLIKYLEKNCG